MNTAMPPRPPLAVLVAISALQPFALNVLAPATPGLARSFGTDYATIQLTLTLYLMAVAATQLVVGPISDRIGRRPCVLAALGLFMAGSLMGAFATSIPALLAARVVRKQGSPPLRRDEETPLERARRDLPTPAVHPRPRGLRVPAFAERVEA